MPRMSMEWPQPLPYPSMRLRACAAALRAFLRRWGVHVVVLAMVAGAGASTPLQVMAALAGWTVAPLFSSAAHGAGLAVGIAAQALFGGGLVWGSRALLWPPRWAEAERALPIAPELQRRSDATVVVLALLPWWTVQALGAASILASRPPWLMAVAGRAVSAWLVSCLAMAALGVAMLRALRMAPGRTGFARQAARAASHSATKATVPTPMPRRGSSVLLALPLLRGPARRTGRMLLLGWTLACLPALWLAWRPSAINWVLAAWALAGLALVTRIHTLIRAELAGLFDAIKPLPINPSRMAQARAAISLSPLLPAAVTLVWATARAPHRTPVLIAYAMALLASCGAEVAARPARSSDKASRWLFSAVLCVCLASEVAP